MLLCVLCAYSLVCCLPDSGIGASDTLHKTREHLFSCFRIQFQPSCYNVQAGNEPEYDIYVEIIESGDGLYLGPHQVIHSAFTGKDILLVQDSVQFLGLFELVLPESLKASLEPFVKGELTSILKGGVNATFTKKIAGGFTIGPKDGGYFISLTDETFKELISEYLRPSTRKLLFGE